MEQCNQTFTVTNNVTSYSRSYLKLKSNEFRQARGLPPHGPKVVINGLTVTTAPLTNYTGYEVTNPMQMLEVQIHEVGHSMHAITLIGYDDDDKFPTRPDLGGKILEDCVRSRRGFKYR